MYLSGSKCLCNPGYTLNSDGKSCSEVVVNPTQCGANMYLSGTQCLCNPGYTLSSDGQSCTNSIPITPVNPVNPTNVTCGKYMQLINNNCECLPGYKLMDDGLNCIAIKTNGSNTNTTTTCTGNMVLTDGQCLCPPGYQLINGTCAKIIVTVVCNTGMHMDNTTKMCVCDNGTLLSKDGKYCYKLTCPAGTIFDNKTNLCLVSLITSPIVGNLITANMTSYQQSY